MAERRFNPFDPLGLFEDKGGSLNDQIAKLGKRNNPTGTEPERVKRYHGQIVEVGDAQVRTVVLPDWGLEYIEFPEGEMPKYRSALMRERVKIRQVTGRRIYFEQ